MSNVATQKIAGIPAWGWVAGGLTLVLVYKYYEDHKTESGEAAQEPYPVTAEGVPVTGSGSIGSGGNSSAGSEGLAAQLGFEREKLVAETGLATKGLEDQTHIAELAETTQNSESEHSGLLGGLEEYAKATSLMQQLGLIPKAGTASKASTTNVQTMPGGGIKGSNGHVYPGTPYNKTHPNHMRTNAQERKAHPEHATKKPVQSHHASTARRGTGGHAAAGGTRAPAPKKTGKKAGPAHKAKKK